MAVPVLVAGSPGARSRWSNGTATRSRVAAPAIEAACVALAMLVLSIGLTWPLAAHFRERITGIDDARHFVWLLWHVREALFGREPLYQTSLLYFPHGTSLVAFSLGPMGGILALPFVGLGFEAAYNGALLVGFTLSGCAAYALARGVGLRREVALFAAVVYVAAPVHLTASIGHFHKAFIGALPLVVLSALRAVDPRRSLAWAVVGAAAMLLALLQSGEQFVFGGLAIAFVAGWRLWRTHPGMRATVALRATLLGGFALLAASPVLVLIAAAIRDPAIEVARAADAAQFRPDLIQFFVPNWSSRLLGAPTQRWLEAVLGARPAWSDVSIPCGVTLLCVVAAMLRGRRAGPWLGFAALFALLALGPLLGVLGRTQFPPFGAALPLPFAALSQVPGLNAIRSTDRFMLVGFAGLAVAAGIGLEALSARTSRGVSRGLAAAAIGLVLVEVWPTPWPQEELPRVPAFYRQIASDPDVYGVFDLPIRPGPTIGYMESYVMYSADYQLMQMTHGKGIASGYLCREFLMHPFLSHVISNGIFPFAREPDVLVDGQPANRFANARYELARRGYRYVVRHKGLLAERRIAPGAWAEFATRRFLETEFAGEEPIFDDDQVSVYSVGPAPEVSRLVPTIALRETWVHGFLHQEDRVRWAISPASFYVASPVARGAHLAIIPQRIYDPVAGEMPAASVTVESAGGSRSTATIHPGQRTVLPIELAAGSQALVLRIDDGILSPRRRAGEVVRFALGTVDLVLSEGQAVAPARGDR